MAHATVTLSIEKLGGFAAFGGAHLQSRGSVAYADLTAVDRTAVDALFEHGDKPSASGVADEFRYKLSRPGAHGVETVMVPVGKLPRALADAVVDSLK